MAGMSGLGGSRPWSHRWLLPRGGIAPLAQRPACGLAQRFDRARLPVLAARGAPPCHPEELTPDGILASPAFVGAWLLWAGPLAGAALAEDVVPYDPSKGSEFVTTAAGFAYVALLAGYLFWILGRRAKKFTSEPLGGPRGGEEAAAEENAAEEAPKQGLQRRLTPADAAFGAAVAGALGLGLFMFARKVDAIYEPLALPEGYTARNVAVTVRTIIRGMSYLATFVFGANAVGLAGLGIKLAMDPSAGDPEVDVEGRRGAPSLPKLSVTSEPGEVARAFDQAMDRRAGVSNSEQPEE